MAKVFKARGLNSRFFCFSLSFELPVHCAENRNKKYLRMGSFTTLTNRKYNFMLLLKKNILFKRRDIFTKEQVKSEFKIICIFIQVTYMVR